MPKSTSLRISSTTSWWQFLIGLFFMALLISAAQSQSFKTEDESLSLEGDIVRYRPKPRVALSEYENNASYPFSYPLFSSELLPITQSSMSRSENIFTLIEATKTKDLGLVKKLLKNSPSYAFQRDLGNNFPIDFIQEYDEKDKISKLILSAMRNEIEQTTGTGFNLSNKDFFTLMRISVSEFREIKQKINLNEKIDYLRAFHVFLMVGKNADIIQLIDSMPDINIELAIVNAEPRSLLEQFQVLPNRKEIVKHLQKKEAKSSHSNNNFINIALMPLLAAFCLYCMSRFKAASLKASASSLFTNNSQDHASQPENKISNIRPKPRR